ncbi:alpha-N-acetylglucosaminidase [Pedobacter sp. AK017]|uniref:alpha-N-acetylglucosaminidase n=1 Tax=Pedobacter sp. AK017 TaxID=2723073 RepID=UPI0017BE9C73|nr:alpha-N-acetylglucosaminidase [Pedobacter sp. AK017]MBB5440312.1 alpha-N-acetylglucosaminidase [Pedobacter sp. AK017]
MRRLKYYLLALMLIGTGISLTAQTTQNVLNKEAAYELIKRILPAYAHKFEVAYVTKENDSDVFELESKAGKIVLRGNNGVAVASALNYWLKNYAHCEITWNGTNLNIPKPFPMVSKKIRKVTPYEYRHYFNYCTFNYTATWWDWERWQWEIDFMALNGVNMPLALTGQNSIWDKVYRSMGFNDKDMDAFFSGPAYTNWFWMGNLDAWGGPMSKNFMDKQEALQKKILARERALGMTPILPSFTGHVPPSFKDKFPDIKVNTQQWGINVAPAYVLNPETPMFKEIGRKFLTALINTFGTDHLYSADTFNEMTPVSNDSTYLNGMAKKIYESMAAVDTQAVWIMQGWMFLDRPNFWQPTQMKALFSAVPQDKLIVLDLNSELNPVWSRTDAFYGEKWIWCMLHNFGGRLSMFGDMSRIGNDPAAALKNDQRGKMSGIGLTMEGIEQNPAIYSLMLEHVWNDKPIDLDNWLKGYAQRRYGKKNSNAEKAWEVLKNTVYSHQPWWGTNTIITGRPTFDAATVWTYTAIPYSSKELMKAWSYLLTASDELKSSDGFQYDLVDVTRQVLANYANVLQQDFASSYKQKDMAAFNKKSAQFLELIDDIDQLLGTRSDFLLGKWINNAKALGDNPAEKKLFERNARDLITLWLDKDCNIHEYACKEWAGMMKGFYKPRWQQFFDEVRLQASAGKEIDQIKFENTIKDWEWKWVNANEAYTDKPTGNPVTVAKALYAKYNQKMNNAFPTAYTNTK